MAIIIRNIGADPVAVANAIAWNLWAQSSTADSAFFHADSTSNNRVADVGYNIPGVPGTAQASSGVGNTDAQGQFVTQSPAVDLVSGIQLAMQIAGALIGQGQTTDPPAHFYDAPNSVPAPISQAGAHKAQDSVNTNLLGSLQAFIAAGGISANQTAANTFANAIQTAFNAHRTQSGVHYNNDTLNVSAAAAASNLGTFITLVNDLRNRVNNHISGANPSVNQVRIVAA